MKKRIGPIVMLAGVLLTLTGMSARADVLTILADEWCPYNCSPASDKPGYMIEIAKKVFEPLGHKVEYKTMSWSRALEMTREGKNVAVAGASPTDAPDFIFPEKSQGGMSTGYFTRKEDSWKPGGASALQNVRIGVIKDYTYVEMIDKHIAEFKKPDFVQVMAGDSALEKNIQKLLANRIDVVVEDVNVFRLTANELKVDDKVRLAGAEKASPVFIAFSPALSKSKEYAKVLSEGVTQLRKSGELAKILKKYGVQDWN